MHVVANNVFIEIRAVHVQKEDLFHLAAYALCMHCISLLPGPEYHIEMIQHRDGWPA